MRGIDVEPSASATASCAVAPSPSDKTLAQIGDATLAWLAARTGDAKEVAPSQRT
jgi:hypothetical protein